MARSLMEPDRQYQVSNMVSAEDGGRRRNHSVRGGNTQKKMEEGKRVEEKFFSIVLIIFIAEVAAGVVALAYSSFAEGIVRAWATPALQKDYGSDPVVTKIWNATMTEMKCCGFTNYTDFVGSQFEKENGGSLPPICCWTNSSPCSPQEAKRSAVEGCFRHILEMVQKHANIVGGIAAGIGVFEIAALIVSMYLYCHLDGKIS